jgi:hypothetical protein
MSDGFVRGWKGIRGEARNAYSVGTSLASPTDPLVAAGIARAALCAIAGRSFDDLSAAVSQFATADEALQAIAAVVAPAIGVPGTSLTIMIEHVSPD